MKPLLALLLLSVAAQAGPRRAAPRLAQQQTRSGQPQAADSDKDKKEDGADETAAPAAPAAEEPAESAAAAEPTTGTASVDAGAPGVPGGPSSKATAPAPKAPGPKALKRETANVLGSVGVGGASPKEKIQTRCGDALTKLPAKLPNGDAIDLKKTAVVKGVRIDDWKITSKLTSVKFGKDEVCTPHSKSGQWPTAPFFGDPATPVEGNMWMYAYLDGRWVGGAGHWLRPGQTCKGGNLWEVGPDVYYDADPLKHWTPCPGEYVAFAVSAPARAGQWTVAERSNVVLVRWPSPAK